MAMNDKDKLAMVRDNMEKMAPRFKSALPRGGMSADRFASMALTACQTNPDLMKCTQRSLFGALVECAQLGLEPSRMTGEV